MKLLVLQGERFSCHSCTNCCRDWHVELTLSEAENTRRLQWPAGDEAHGANILFQHGGRTYLAHRPDGSCVFLNLANGRCRIHEQFGAESKPLGCRLFPFQITPTFKGEATVTGRFDCPTVRKNIGAEHGEELPNVRRLAGTMELPDGFDEKICCHLGREQIEMVVEFVGTMLPGFKTDAQRALFIVLLCDGLAGTGVDELDRSSLAGAFTKLKELVEAMTSRNVERPGIIHRLAFRTLLGMYLRRDEDVLNRRAGRISRTIAMLAFVLGFGSFRGLGRSHPKGKLRRARFFQSSLHVYAPDTLALFWRLIRITLESFQFMGAGNSGQDFLHGLRSLAMLYPLVLAAAKYSAANRDAARIEIQDVEYAVAAIEHSFGRSAILKQPFTRSLEKALRDPKVFVRLIMTI
jgi:Fe-S-cluster containining protein